MENRLGGKTFTVQGGDTPVPASVRGARAGPGTSSTNDCNAKEADHLAPLAQNATSTEEICQRTTALEQRVASSEATIDDTIRALKIYSKSMQEAAKIQKNVSMGIKNGLQKLEEAIDIIETNRNICKKARKAIQTLASIQAATTAAQTPKRSRSGVRTASSPLEDGGTAPQNSKKKKETANPTDWTTVHRKKEKRSTVTPTPKSQRQSAPEAAENASSQRKRKKERNKIRQEAVLIRPASGITYADILREIRSKVSPDTTETDIRAIRQTRAGDVLLELGGQSKNKETFSDALRDALGETGTVRNLVPRTTLEIRDLDGHTSREEVEEALKRDLKDPTGEIRVSVTKTNSRGQRLAIVELDEQAAGKLLAISHIKVGWVNCRIRLRVIVARCYKCLGYGHQARNCTGPDRGHLCYKCGKSGHKAAGCIAAPCCILCTDLQSEPEQLHHVPGTGVCKAFRSALEQAKKKAR